MNEEMAICTICGEEKLITEFESEQSECSVCAWVIKHNNLFDINDLSIDDNRSILDGILNNKVAYLNDFELMLNIPLDILLVNIQKLEIKTKKPMVKTICEACHAEIYYNLTNYLKRKNYFCSVKCRSLWQSNTYGCQEGYQKCSKCGEEKLIEEFHKNGKDKYRPYCKVCSYFKGKDIKISENWSIDEYKIILHNLLNKKVDCINDITPLLVNKTLEDIIDILHTELIICVTDIKIRFDCEQCNTDVYRPIQSYLNANNHFCSIECHDIWQTTSIQTKCDNCSKPITIQPSKLEKNKYVFCCHKCSSDFSSKQGSETRNCIRCNEEFDCVKSSKKKLCSVSCAHLYFSTEFKGENSSLYKQFPINCDWCGEEYNVQPSQFNKSTNHFCSKDCRSEWFKNVYSQTDEVRERTRKRTLQLLADGKMSHTNTGIQLKVNSLLTNMNIKFTNEETFEYYSVDNYLPDFNGIIEVMGTFWHCDSRKYSTINYVNQYKAIIRDKAKHTYFKNRNINVLYLWEHDINNNIELCKVLINQYILGCLDSYHSSNYCFKNNDIILNDDIIIPFMEHSSDRINSILDLTVKEKISRKQIDKWIIFECDYCGELIEDHITRYDKNKNHYCSNECKNKAQEKSIMVKCETCNKDIQTTPSLYAISKTKQFYCCRICYEKSREKDLFLCNCDNCKHEIQVTKIQDHNFCDRNCYDKFRAKNKGSKQEDKWITYSCEVCGNDKSQLIMQYNKHKHHFCGKECHDFFQKQEISFNCEYCSQITTKRQADYNRSTHHFCSKSCSVSYNNIHRHDKKD